MKDLELKNIEGIGPAAVKKLKDADILTVKELATYSIESLAEAIGCTKDLANKYIQNAHLLLREHGIIAQEFVDGNEALSKRESVLRLKTGSTKLDTFLKGGIETQAITELYGEFGSGKSQLCHILSIQVSKPIEEGGLGGKCIFLDTEATFRPERIKEMCELNELNTENVLANIKVCRIHNSGHLEDMINKIDKFVEEFGAKMVIVDSIIALHRGDYSGRGTLAERQQKINAILHKLLRVAETYGIVVIITNQVTASPDTFFGDPIKPTGGHIIGHNATYRLYLRKSGKNRLVKMVDSPYHAADDIKIKISEKGIEDAEE